MLDRPSPRYTHAAGWTPGRIERLTKLWNEGWSASKIMDDLGGGLTRCAVIGKVHRLKLPARITVVSVVSKPKSHGAGGLAFRINKARKDGLTPAEAMRAVFGRDDDPSFVDPDDGVDVTNLVGLADLKSHDCRWPSGDPLTSHFGFCGKPAVEGKPYCDEHCALAYIGWRP